MEVNHLILFKIKNKNDQNVEGITLLQLQLCILVNYLKSF